MSFEKTRKWLLLFCEVAVIVTTVLCLYSFFRNGSFCENLKYFTIESNILAGLVALIMLPFTVKELSGKADSTPKWVLILFHSAEVSVTITMLTVVCFLGFVLGWKAMYSGTNLWFHLTNPLLMLVAGQLLTGRTEDRLVESLWGAIPVVLYGIIYMYNVVYALTWSDFYSFNRDGKLYITLIFMYSLTFIISGLLWKLHLKKKA